MSKKKSKVKSNEVVQTIEMRKEDAAVWLDALGSGKYKRTTGVLIDKDYECLPDGTEVCKASHCCLGVLQDVLGKVQEDNGLPTLRWLQDHKIKVTLPKDEKLEDGRKTQVDIALIPAVNGYSSVAKLNDSGKYSFKSIAKILDKRIKRV